MIILIFVPFLNAENKTFKKTCNMTGIIRLHHFHHHHHILHK